MNDELVVSFRRFLLSSSKNTEQFDSAMLAAMSVDTELEDTLADAVGQGRDVVIAGTAGSGKTHLLNSLSKRCPELVVVEFGDEEPKRGKFVRVVSDLTALPAREHEVLFARPSRCIAVVVAANEGTLLSAADRSSGGSATTAVSSFGAAREILHRMQRGEAVRGDEGPVVLDAAGYDPAAAGGLAKMLRLPLLTAVVDGSACNCPEGLCPRRNAWLLLQEPESAERLATLVSAAALEAEGFTFRLLWNFVADLALGGDCGSRDGCPPTAPWFWRAFRGDSFVADQLMKTFPARLFPLPGVESRLWYGDWKWFEAQEQLRTPSMTIVPATRRPSDLPNEPAGVTFEWLKLQLLFLLAGNPLAEMRMVSAAGRLWSDIVEGRQHELIRQLNLYMTYGLASGGSNLELWIDYAMERRNERPSGQVSLGCPPATKFRIARSHAAGNVAGDGRLPLGVRLFLRHDASGASLALTKDRLRVIVEGRSSRMVDRVHTEVDWVLMSFFSRVAAREANANHLRLAFFDFKARRMRQADWDVMPTGPVLTLTSGSAS